MTMASKSILDITVSPKSSKNKISIDESNHMKVYLTSPPVDGKANTELIALFSKSLKIPKSDIEIISGLKSKKKRLVILGLTLEEIFRKIQSL
jgi:uncharacterized protein (TIGR00251 family)